MEENPKALFETIQGLRACPSLSVAPAIEQKFIVIGYFEPSTSKAHPMGDLERMAKSISLEQRMLASHIDWTMCRNADHSIITTLTYQGKVYVKVESVQTVWETYYEWDQDRNYDPGRQVMETTRSTHYFPPKEEAGFSLSQLDWKDPGLCTTRKKD